MNESRFHALIERSAEGVSIFDGQANILYESPSNKRIHGYDAEEMVGRNLFDYCHPEDQERVMPTVLRIAAKPGNFDTDIVRFRHKAGHYIYLEGTVLNAFDDPRIQGMVNNFRDVTVRIEAERELKEAKESLERAHHQRQRFLANLSHELKTPLTLVREPLRELEHLPVNGKQARSLRQMILRNLDRLDSLIHDLVELSVIDSGEYRLKAKQADVANFLREQVGLFMPLARDRRIALQCSVPDICQAYFDASKLASVVGNLLSNALKFTPPGGEVRFQARLAEGTGVGDHSLLVTVQDNGRGMTPATAAHVFDRFFQAQSEDNREFEGMGIGLSITREIIELHGGLIEVKSRPGQGSEFRFTLPLGVDHLSVEDIDLSTGPETGQMVSPVSKPIPLPHPETRQEAEGVKPKLLLVEDNPDMSAFLVLHMEKRFEVHVAPSGQVALDCVENSHPDVILSDVMMPGMDGLAFTRSVRARPETASIPIVLLSAKGTAQHRVEGLAAGANDYIAKPFSVHELHLRLANVLPDRRVPPVQSAASNQRQRMLDYIDAHMADSGFGVEALAAGLGLSLRNLHRKALELNGVTSSTLIRERRLLRARALIEGRAFETLGEVAVKVGFAPSYLSRAYRSHFGKLPALAKP